MACQLGKGTVEEVDKINSFRSSVTLFVCPILKPDDEDLLIFCEGCQEWFHRI